MAPFHQLLKRVPQPAADGKTESPSRASMNVDDTILEAWAQGFNLGSLVILILMVLCNYRRGTILHKLILLELVLALWHGTFIFFADPVYGWYLSATATLLFISYQLHNVVSWLKIKRFLPKWGSWLFIGTLMAVQPFWVVEAWSNFEYFNHLGSKANVKIRPYEALLRDPWWIFTTCFLISVIKKSYNFTLVSLVKLNRRFGVLLGCMFLSIIFLITDIAVTAARATAASGINPFWRFALVFKCASDTIFLDDFKSVLDDIVAHRFGQLGGSRHRAALASQNRSGTNYGLGSNAGGRGKDAVMDRNPGVQQETHVTAGNKRPSVLQWLDPFKRSRQSRNESHSAVRGRIQHTTEMMTTSEPWDHREKSPGGGSPPARVNTPSRSNPPRPVAVTRIERNDSSYGSPRESRAF